MESLLLHILCSVALTLSTAYSLSFLSQLGSVALAEYYIKYVKVGVSFVRLSCLNFKYYKNWKSMIIAFI